MQSALPPAAFEPYTWQRPGGGGGTARVLSGGRIFERAGVNVSAVYGEQVPQSLWRERPELQGQPYFATGISLVLHPRNPYVPAFHANYRYFDVGDDWWFGGGMDLTPCYGFVEDAALFHRTLRDYCARHPAVNYAALKQACDDYFFIRHRGEMRGIGGIFFDHLHPEGSDGWERAFAFMQGGTATIIAAYLPLVQRRMQHPYGERERAWQLYRRGRYVEFNLVYDRGTVFGLQTGGDTEAILMSLPPLARWAFREEPAPDSPEAALANFLQPHPWAEDET
jgi:coproporphyrinogen III oxidase